MSIIAWILTLAIITGQLIKLPLSQNSGITLLDTTVLVLCIFGLFRLRFKLKKPPIFVKSALFFILIALFSLILTPLRLSLPEYLTSFLYTGRFVAYILLSWLIFSGAFPTIKNNIPKILIFSGLALAILGLTQLIFWPDLGFLAKDSWDPHYFRTVSTFLDPNFLGGFLVLTLLLLTSKTRIGGSDRTPGVFYIVFFLIYLALLTTFSRGSYLAFFTAFIILSFLHRSFRMGMITILLFLGLFLGFFTYQKSVAQPRGVDRDRSAKSRLGTLQQGGMLFQTHFILGVGFNTYRYALEQYNLGDQEFLSSRGSSTNDSSLLFVAATTGIIGLSSFLFFIYSLIWTKKYNPLLIAGLSGLIIQSFFSNTLFYPFNLIWIMLMSSKQYE
ncbi:MAG: O-antigen ligase family protein [Candidatus Daviesbacteria bacterium]|nr:O-antigen ligase family protein [Candidatus Daviesbacteria bacterium]